MSEELEGFDTEDKIEQACEWIIALAADDYFQTTGVMHKNVHDNTIESWVVNYNPSYGMCCLGVLRSMAHPDIPELDEKSPEESELAWSEPAPWEREQYGIHLKGLGRLVMFNDEDQLTFPEIAKELVAAPKQFFHKAVAEGVAEYFIEVA